MSNESAGQAVEAHVADGPQLMENRMFEGVREQYGRIEPERTDCWNPLFKENELWHRLRLFSEMREVLVRMRRPPTQCRILDVGCGEGRSTRMFLELGCKPENVTGLDIRPEAISYAKATNPAINFIHIGDLSELARFGKFDLVSCCTVFSSIRERAERGSLAEAICLCVEHHGGVFWWDRLRANDFAGGDELRPEEYFQGWQIQYRHVCPLRWRPGECLRPLRGLAPFVASFVNRLGHRPSHMATLLRRPGNHGRA